LDDWPTVFAGFRAAFVERLPTQLSEAREALESLSSTAGSDEALTSLHRVFHKVAGSAGTYLFDEIARVATDAESLCRRLMDRGGSPETDHVDELARYIVRIDSACAEAQHELSTVNTADFPAGLQRL